MSGDVSRGEMLAGRGRGELSTLATDGVAGGGFSDVNGSGRSSMEAVSIKSSGSSSSVPMKGKSWRSSEKKKTVRLGVQSRGETSTG